MVGLLQQQMQPQQPAGAPAPGSPQGAGPQYRSKAVEAIPPDLREAFERVVLAGMQVLYSEETQDLVRQELGRDVPVWRKLAESIAGLMGILQQQSTGQMPQEVIIPAAIELVHEAAAFVAESGMEQVSDEDLKQAAQYVVVLLMRGMGADDNQIGQVLTGGGAAGAQAAPAAPPAGAQAAPVGV